MSRRRQAPPPLSRREVPAPLRAKARPPLAVVLGSPAEAAHLLAGLGAADAVCYQMDLYQAEKLAAGLAGAGVAARVRPAPDLWDLPAEFQTAVYMPPRGGERELKIDMVEQAFHVLRPGGALVVWSSYEDDPFFPPLLKKVFGRVHEHRSPDGDTVLWAQRTGDRPRRRHEVAVQARVGDGPSCRFVTRPGVFSYGRLDDGARALAETAVIEPGARVVDVGCGWGAVGVFAGLRCGPEGRVAFLDSNVRAVALAELNARANGLTAFDAVASSAVSGPPEESFDIALANPPYYADHAITRLFVERSRALLRPGGRLYLVTKQPDAAAEAMAEAFGAVEAVERRGYVILCA
jgi:16S rRNA (guanine1207-N2)-methyltransferase